MVLLIEISLIIHTCIIISLYALLIPVEALSLGGIQHVHLPKKAAIVEYDLVIIGAGASGLFASGAAVSFGLNTLLVDQGSNYVGGDCTNCACVPSKALRSASRKVHTNNQQGGGGASIATTTTEDHQLLTEARDHVVRTVLAVRKREAISNFDNTTNLKLELVKSSRFVSKDEIELTPRQGSRIQYVQRIRAKKFLIATGASPIVPTHWYQEAFQAGLPLFTYRDILSPESGTFLWNQLLQKEPFAKQIVIAGGGPTAIEIGQALVRLKLNVTLVAPTLLAAEDVSLQQAACKVLHSDGVRLVLGKRVASISCYKDIILDDGTAIKADALVVCVGRNPTVKPLQLDAAGVAWDETSGVHVHSSSLRSKTNARVYACGDCCSVVSGRNRKAAHAGWTGFHAIRNLALPRILWAGSASVHPAVPSVTYSDPELASVGLTRSECIQKYGSDGFLYQSLREEGSDRADMERMERNVDAPFVELRADRRTGRILGLTACGPAAAELVNEIGLAIQSKLTVRDLARAIHSYPSHGYPLYRLALAMTLSSTRGFLDTLGPLCQLLGKVSGVVGLRRPKVKQALPWMRRRIRKRREWEALGQQSVMIVPDTDDTSGLDLPVSYLDYFQNEIDWAGELPKAYLDWEGQLTVPAMHEPMIRRGGRES